MLYERVGGLLAALLVHGPGGDTGLREFVATIEERRIGNTGVVTHLTERYGLRPGLEPRRAVDLLWTLTGFELADRLVRRCGWSLVAYERWLGDTLVASLVGDP